MKFQLRQSTGALGIYLQWSSTPVPWLQVCSRALLWARQEGICQTEHPTGLLQAVASTRLSRTRKWIATGQKLEGQTFFSACVYWIFRLRKCNQVNSQSARRMSRCNKSTGFPVVISSAKIPQKNLLPCIGRDSSWQGQSSQWSTRLQHQKGAEAAAVAFTHTVCVSQPCAAMGPGAHQ